MKFSRSLRRSLSLDTILSSSIFLFRRLIRSRKTRFSSRNDAKGKMAPADSDNEWIAFKVGDRKSRTFARNGLVIALEVAMRAVKEITTMRILNILLLCVRTFIVQGVNHERSKVRLPRAFNPVRV